VGPQSCAGDRSAFEANPAANDTYIYGRVERTDAGILLAPLQWRLENQATNVGATVNASYAEHAGDRIRFELGIRRAACERAAAKVPIAIGISPRLGALSDRSQQRFLRVPIRDNVVNTLLLKALESRRARPAWRDPAHLTGGQS
jgi:hypothetical protein